MGANLYIKKPSGALMTREDMVFMATNSSYCDLSCFIKRDKEDEFEKLCKEKTNKSILGMNREETTKLFTDIPDEWFDFRGAVLDSVSYSTRADFQNAFRFHIPIWDYGMGCECDAISWKDCVCKRLWMSPEELKRGLDNVPIKFQKEYDGCFDMLKCVAEREFECMWDT